MTWHRGGDKPIDDQASLERRGASRDAHRRNVVEWMSLSVRGSVAPLAEWLVSLSASRRSEPDVPGEMVVYPSSMPMPTTLTRALRSLSLVLTMAGSVIAATPPVAAASTPREMIAQASAIRPRPKAKVTQSRSRHASVAHSSRAARSSRGARASHRSRAGGRHRGSRSLRRSHSRRHIVRRDLGPIVPSVEQASFVSDSADALRDSIVSVARQQIGTAYVWGAETPGRAFDCSGLVKYVMSWLNVRLPRTANEQAYTGIRVGRNLDRLKPGDLITFGTGRRITHIGIYAGNSRYVHASRPGVGVVESLLNPSARRFRGAVRLVADADSLTEKSAPIP
jgi:cell wall-associated NlpC family hydrolase